MTECSLCLEWFGDLPACLSSLMGLRVLVKVSSHEALTISLTSSLKLLLNESQELLGQFKIARFDIYNLARD